MARGQAAMEAGDLPDAERWLDRARRIAGGNDAVDLLLATLRFRLGQDAIALFSGLAARHDLREAWLGLATAQHRAGNTQAAAAALHQALCGHAADLQAAVAALATEIARAAGAPGWCGLDAAGALRIETGRLRPELDLDGARLRPASFKLPANLPQDLPPDASRLAVTTKAGTPLGSPLELDRIRRLEAFVDAQAGGLAGWAWYPNHPARLPRLRVSGAAGGERALALGAPGGGGIAETQGTDRPLAQRRVFSLAAADLPGPGPYRVTSETGRDLPGSPLDPGAFARYALAVTRAVAGQTPDPAVLREAPVPAAFIGSSPAIAPRPARPAIVIPVYRGLTITLACLDRVLANTPAGSRIVVVDDAGPEPALTRALDDLEATGRIELIRHDRNRGFPAAANTGLRAVAPEDAVLLNADTLVPRNWLQRLRDAAYAAPDTGTATPLSNDATLLSYPNQQGDNPVPDGAEVDRIDRLAARANRGLRVEIPTAIGFCMYIRADCLAQTGMLREDAFAQGYGEENDFCLRARHLGWRHVAACDLFVGHVGGVSFGAARTALLERNLATLNRLHPGYDALIAEDSCGPALARARRAIDLAALAARTAKRAAPAVILITHDLGGGVERQVRARAAAIAKSGRTPIILRPVLEKPYLKGTGQCRVDVARPGADLPNLVFDVATEWAALCNLLAAQRPARVELHHMLGHHRRLISLASALGVPYDVHLHDYSWFCPRVTLVADQRYCGEPDLAACDACIADHGHNVDEDILPSALVPRAAADLAAAARIVAPAADVAQRYARHFPALRPVIEPWDRQAAPPPRALPPPSEARPRIIGVLGAIGVEKGYAALLACARDAAARALALRFVVLGHTTDDARLLATGVCFVTGEYAPPELAALVAAHRIDRAFLPSIWPETWCFTLSEAWRCGLEVVAFDLGAPAERLREAEVPAGALLPLGARPAQINARLLASRI